MSMTETPCGVATIENALSPAALARLARIQELARKNRRQYAIEKSATPPTPKAPARQARPKPVTTAASKPKPSKAARPYFYNPSKD
jgi:hypothetical protein